MPHLSQSFCSQLISIRHVQVGICTSLLICGPAACASVVKYWFVCSVLFFLLKGKYILTPSPITYAEEQLFHFFGQLLGIAIRADVPLPLDLLPSFWKTLVGEPLDPDVDLQEADILTYNYVKKFENVSNFFLFPPAFFFQRNPHKHTVLIAARFAACPTRWWLASLLADVVRVSRVVKCLDSSYGCRTLPPDGLKKLLSLFCCQAQWN